MTAIAAPLKIATPTAQAAPLDPKYANNKDYQAASATLAKAKAAADALSKQESDLEVLQKNNPTPERQIQLSDLSARVNQANGAAKLAQNKVDAVKKEIDGPAIIVGDDPGQPTSPGTQSIPTPK